MDKFLLVVDQADRLNQLQLEFQTMLHTLVFTSVQVSLNVSALLTLFDVVNHPKSR